MNDYRFILDTKSKKFLCPECNKRTLVKYIDTTTGEYLPDYYGRCDREIKCNYHLNPYKDGFAKMIWEKSVKNGNNSGTQMKRQTLYMPQPKQQIKAPSFIPYEILAATRKGYEQNIFIQNLLHRVKFPFDKKDIEQAISLYHLGTICKGYRSGAITFPFIDFKGKVRAIQVKQFDETNHTISTDFIHSILEKYYTNENKPLPGWLKSYLLNETKVSGLFGEHLLTKYQTNSIALVEAPKTAIISTLYFGMPDNPKNFLWLAVYNLSSLNIEKCKVLQGRKVVLFPDLNAYENWSSKAKQFQKELPGTTFKVSNLIQNLATKEDKEKGFDIADLLTRMDWRKFRKIKPELSEAIKKRPELLGTIGNYWENIKIEPLAKNGEKCQGLKKEPEPITFIIPESVIKIKPKDLEPPKEHFIKCEDWKPELIELEKYFKAVSLPATVQLNKAAKITNVPLFIDTHFQTLNNYNGNKTFLPYLKRLKDLKQFIVNNN